VQVRGIGAAAHDGANRPPGKQVFNDKGLDYYVGTKIGSGNFGVVHDCFDGFGQDFVIKVLKTNRPIEEVQADWAKETQVSAQGVLVCLCVYFTLSFCDCSNCGFSYSPLRKLCSFCSH